jgi:4-hydroxythreonine-4-phosphate dehydrogenase
MGDPAGIGPEIISKALSDPEIASLAHWIVCADASVLPLQPHYELRGLKLISSGECVEPGVVCGGAGRAALGCVHEATMLCLRGEAAAMVTAPVNKEAITIHTRHFTGHTEYIAGLCGATESRMMLASERLRVVHVTTHVPLRRASEVDTPRIFETIRLARQATQKMGFADPRIAVCGINPHAGEHGLFGDEDDRAVAPAVRQAREMGYRCDGPVPADTAFLRALRGEWDVVVAMYHDQGHIPMKLLDFEGTVNVTLGIPIIRTSVDHGTAFDIAGKGIADPTNMKAAMRLAVRMAQPLR